MGMGLRSLVVACVASALCLLIAAPDYYWAFAGGLLVVIASNVFVLRRTPKLELADLSPAAWVLNDRYYHAFSAPRLTKITRVLIGAFILANAMGAGAFSFYTRWIEAGISVAALILGMNLSARIDPTAYIAQVVGSQANDEIICATIAQKGENTTTAMTRKY